MNLTNYTFFIIYTIGTKRALTDCESKLRFRGWMDVHER